MKIIQLKIVFLFVFLVTTSQAQNKNGTFTLSGSIKGFSNGTIDVIFDSATKITSQIHDGKFLITGKLKRGPVSVNLILNPGNWSYPIFLAPSDMTVDIDTNGAHYYDYRKYGGQKGVFLEKVVVSGSTENTDYKAFEKYSNMELPAGGMDEVRKKRLDYVKKFIEKKPSSVAGAAMLNYLAMGDLPANDLKPLVKRLRNQAKQSVYFDLLQKQLAEYRNVEPGQLAEDFTLLKPDSTKFTLSSTRGKYVMLDFWASWCKPCRAAIPHWKDIYTKYRDKGFEIVAVTNDSNWEDWKKAMDVEQMPWIQVADEFKYMKGGRVISKYKYPTIPLYVLLDKKGKILLKTANKEEIDRKLEELFKAYR